MAEAEELHGRSLVVWDLPPAVPCGEVFACVIGLRCESAACAPSEWPLAIRDESGALVAESAAGDAVWPGTTGLYYRRLELTAPAEPGLYRWQLAAPAAGEHAKVTARLNLRTVAPGDCRLRVVAIDAETGAPVPGLRVVVHPHRSLTDATGTAELELPPGEFRLFVTGRDFFPFRCDGELEGNTTIRAELQHDRGPSDAEIWS